MTKPFVPPTSFPNPLPIPYQQRDGYRKDGTPRLGKWKVRTDTVYAANEYFWCYYHGEHPKGYVPIFLDTRAPLDTSPDNLVLLTTRELKNLVHHNNRIYSHDKELQQTSVALVKLRIVIADLEKEVKDYERKH